MEHRDSMGNQGDLRAGGVQWMKAATYIRTGLQLAPAHGELKALEQREEKTTRHFMENF